MRIRHLTVLATAVLTLAACSGHSSGPKHHGGAKGHGSHRKIRVTRTPRTTARALGIPPEPTPAERAELLRALAAANPGVVKYEDKAVDAARNQCGAINGRARNLDRSAAQRFTYRDVTTTEAQGRQINDALRGLGFCTR
ncbi:hypothetical protein RM764_22585 [Streptomyces sp. DSM 41699]|uniref:DUF732 domain-containing protein n=2 Tax=Streptomyces gibsoniae TaxID=3075529 RepID=A0ABU2TXQ9_9ACTN|nr:hypothetical protein [Streptomyces sp. DSM 41699]